MRSNAVLEAMRVLLHFGQPSSSSDCLITSKELRTMQTRTLLRTEKVIARIAGPFFQPKLDYSLFVKQRFAPMRQQRLHSGIAAFQSANPQHSVCDIRQPQIANFRCPQPMTVSKQNHGPIADT